MFRIGARLRQRKLDFEFYIHLSNLKGFFYIKINSSELTALKINKLKLKFGRRFSKFLRQEGCKVELLKVFLLVVTKQSLVDIILYKHLEKIIKMIEVKFLFSSTIKQTCL